MYGSPGPHSTGCSTRRTTGLYFWARASSSLVAALAVSATAPVSAQQHEQCQTQATRRYSTGDANPAQPATSPDGIAQPTRSTGAPRQVGFRTVASPIGAFGRLTTKSTVMITALLRTIQLLNASSPVRENGPRASEKTSGGRTPADSILTRTASAATWSHRPPAPAPAISAAAAAVERRVVRAQRESAKTAPPACAAVKSSRAFIQPGIAVSPRALGRPRDCLTTSNEQQQPETEQQHVHPVARSPASLPPTSPASKRTTDRPTASRPAERGRTPDPSPLPIRPGRHNGGNRHRARPPRRRAGGRLAQSCPMSFGASAQRTVFGSREPPRES